MTTYKNLVLAIFNSTWSAIIAFCLIPVYVNYLGIETYAIISLYVTLNLFLQIFDFGIYPTLIRKTAQNLNQKSHNKFEKTVQNFLIVNIIVSSIIFVSSIAFSDFFALTWLNKTIIPFEIVSNSIMLIGILIAIRWPILIFQAILFGSKFAKHALIINVLMVSFNAIGALVLIILFSANIVQFFIWQIFSSGIYTITIFIICKKKTNINFWGKFNFSDLKNSLQLSYQLWLVTASGILITQVDKLILSNLLSLDKFGIYMLAASSAAILQIIINPFYTIFYPKFSKLYIENNIKEICHLYGTLVKSLSSVLLPLGLFIIISSEFLLFIWTGDKNLSSSIAPVFNLLLAASVFNGITYIPYIIQLSFGKNWIPLSLNILFTIINIPLIIVFVKWYGFLGGGLVLLLNQIIIFFINPLLIQKYVSNKIIIKDFLYNTTVPILTFLLGIIIYFLFLKTIINNDYQKIFIGLVFLLLTLMFNIIIFKDTRNALFDILNYIFRLQIKNK